MKLISHRGNLTGKNIERENTPDYIDEALSKGYDVEVDVWTNPGSTRSFFLGHDGPMHQINPQFLRDRWPRLWIHCKTVRALDWCIENQLHCFSHDQDIAVLTSKGYVWPYPGREVAGMNIICVLPERQERYKDLSFSPRDFAGICSDYIEIVKENIHA